MGTPASTPKTPTLVTVMVPLAQVGGRAAAGAGRAPSGRPGRVVSSRRVRSVRVLDVRHDQAARARHGDAQVDVVLRHHLAGRRRPTTSSGRDGRAGRARRRGRRRPAASRAAPRSAGCAAAARPAPPSASTSTVRNTQAWGAVATLRTMASAMCFWTPRTGALVSRSDSSAASAAATAEMRGQVLARDDAAGTVAGTRRPGRRPFWRAMKRTGGAASGRAGRGRRRGRGRGRAPGARCRCGAGGSGAPPTGRSRRASAPSPRLARRPCGSSVAASVVDGDERGTDGDRLPRRGQQLDDGAGEGAGQLDHGLLGLHLDEDLVQRHLVADGDVPGHDLGLGRAPHRGRAGRSAGRRSRPGGTGRPRGGSGRRRAGSGARARDGGYGVAKPPTRRTGASRW